MLDRVPYEIFSRIVKFSYTSHSFHSWDYSLDISEMSVPPIKATHVCRVWRTALLSDPTMWTSIILTEKNKICLGQLNETVYRSGSCPLDILVDHYDDPLEPYLFVYLCHMLSVVSQQMHRCRQLQIVLPAQLAPFVFHCLDKPVPMLQKFYLDVFKDDEDSSEPEDILKEMHEVLFSGHSPNLEHARLQISGGLGNLQLSLFNNLSSLYLFFGPDTVIHGDILLDIFQSSPCLLMLDILWNFYTTQVLLIPSNRRIPLPQLQNLSLRGNCSVDLVNLVLRHLEFPTENIKFGIACDDSHLRISEATLLLHFLSQRRFTFFSISDGVLELMIDFIEKMDQGSADSKFRVICDYARVSMEGLPEFLRTFNLLDITHMSLGYLSLRYAVLRNILVSLANLRYLLIQHTNLDEDLPSRPIKRSYFKALVPRRQHSSRRQGRASSELDTDDSTTDQESSIKTNQRQLFPCPSLRTLEIRFSYDLLPVRLDKAYLPALVRCSRIREQAGYSLNCIANCCKSLDLAEDIEAWLQVHGGFSIEVRAAR